MKEQILKNIRCEVLDIPGVHNVRDLGGYFSADGRRVRHRRFIRSAGLHHIGEEGLASLRDLGVGCIVDLRSCAEVNLWPDCLPADGSIVYHHVPMLDYVPTGGTSGLAQADYPTSIVQLYTGMLEQFQESIRNAFAIFADPGCRTVLFHCAAGKDRTGLVAMLLLSIAGVDDESVAEDYGWSMQLLPRYLPDDGDPGYLSQTLPRTIHKVLAYLRDQYGGVREYLESAGITSGQLDAVVARLLDD